MESEMFRRVAAGEMSAAEVCARAAENPEYLGSWEVRPFKLKSLPVAIPAARCRSPSLVEE